MTDPEAINGLRELAHLAESKAQQARDMWRDHWTEYLSDEAARRAIADKLNMRVSDVKRALATRNPVGKPRGQPIPKRLTGQGAIARSSRSSSSRSSPAADANAADLAEQARPPLPAPRREEP